MPAQGAYYQTAGDLLEYCRLGSPFCTGYIAGVVDTLSLTHENAQICIPANVPLGRVQKVVTDYLSVNDSMLKRPAEPVVWAALVEVWPCL